MAGKINKMTWYTLGMSTGGGTVASSTSKKETLYIWKWQRSDGYTVGINGGGDPRKGHALDPRIDGATSEQADTWIQQQKDHRPEVNWIVRNI